VYCVYNSYFVASCLQITIDNLYFIPVKATIFSSDGRAVWDKMFRHTCAIFRSGYYLQLMHHELRVNSCINPKVSTLCYTIFFSLDLQPPWILASAFQFHDHCTDGRTPWTVISSSQSLYLNTGQHKHRINAHTIHAFEWDSNPRSRLPSER
jgi:hypothetical protein